MPKRAQTIAQIRLRRATLGKRRPRARARLPRQLEPNAIRLEYYRAIREYLDRARAMIEARVLPMLPALAAEARGDRMDATGKRVNEEMDRISEQYYREVMRPADIERLAGKIANRTDDFQRAQLDKQIRSAFGVDVIHAEPNLTPAIERFTSENVALIKSIPNQYFDQVESTIMRRTSEGARHEDIARGIQERYAISKSRALLVARDQVGKFYGSLNKVRQESLGVDGYIWRTVNDNRVREEHEALDGERFTWAEGHPSEGHPGHAVNCRCYADPDLSAILNGTG